MQSKTVIINDLHTVYISEGRCRLKFLDEVVYVRADLFWSFLIYKVTHSFHHNHFLQVWYFFLKATIMYILLNAWSVVCKVQVSHNKLHRYFDLYSSPWCREFPGSADKTKFTCLYIHILQQNKQAKLNNNILFAYENFLF